jgi:hypothetical protein
MTTETVKKAECACPISGIDFDGSWAEFGLCGAPATRLVEVRWIDGPNVEDCTTESIFVCEEHVITNDQLTEVLSTQLLGKWRTMTVNGGYGNEYTALEVLDAIHAAEADGYEVLDVVEDLLVIAG